MMHRVLFHSQPDILHTALPLFRATLWHKKGLCCIFVLIAPKTKFSKHQVQERIQRTVAHASMGNIFKHEFFPFISPYVYLVSSVCLLCKCLAFASSFVQTCFLQDCTLVVLCLSSIGTSCDVGKEGQG